MECGFFFVFKTAIFLDDILNKMSSQASMYFIQLRYEKFQNEIIT